MVIALTALLLFLGLFWLAPWNDGYTPEEKRYIYIGCAVMPIASFLAANLISEFILKGFGFLKWSVGNWSQVSWPSRILGILAGILALPCFVIVVFGGNNDVWGYLCGFIGIFLAYWFFRRGWFEMIEKKYASNQSLVVTPLADARDAPQL